MLAIYPCHGVRCRAYCQRCFEFYGLALVDCLIIDSHNNRWFWCRRSFGHGELYVLCIAVDIAQAHELEVNLIRNIGFKILEVDGVLGVSHQCHLLVASFQLLCCRCFLIGFLQNVVGGGSNVGFDGDACLSVYR